jgi:hypothetical protein
VGSATEPSSAKEIIQGYETARLDCEIYLIQNNARPWISRFKAESQPAPGLINYTPNPDPAFAPFADAFMSGIAPEFLKLFGTVYGVKPLVLTLPDARSMRIGPDGPGAGTETLFATIVCALDSIDPNWTATDTAKAEIPAMILSLVTDPSSYTSELCNLLTRIDPEWRMSSVSKQVGSQLVAMLGHNVWDGTSEDYIRRHKAICVLGDLRTAEAVPVLTNLLTADKHIVLRMDAAQTLKEITGKHFDYSQ